MNVQNNITRLRWCFINAQQNFAPDHQFGQLGGAGFCGLDRCRHFTPSHNADGVRCIHNLAQLVRDQNDRFAFFFQSLKDAEQLIGFCRGQHTRRFVQNQNIGLTIKRLKDFDTLLHPYANVLDNSVRVDVQLVFFGKLQQRLSRFAQRGTQQLPVLSPKNNIFEDCKILDQFKVLEHHSDTSRNCGLTVGNLRLFARDENLTGVRFVKTIQNRHERRFTGTVFTDDPVDRAGHDRNRNVLVCLDRAKGF